MAKTAKERVKDAKNREDEYRTMRKLLMDIVEAKDTTNKDRINAINTIYMIDTEGVPIPKGWQIVRVFI